jgi:hypothetical protein
MRNYSLTQLSDSLKINRVVMKEIESKKDQLEHSSSKKVAMTNAEKQKRYREKQKERGLQEMRGYMSPEAKRCYKLISEQTNWSDSVILSNAVRLTYAAYKNGQIGLLNSWLKNNKL